MKAARETPVNARTERRRCNLLPKGEGKLSGGRIAAGRFSGHGICLCFAKAPDVVVSRQDREPTYSENRGVSFLVDRYLLLTNNKTLEPKPGIDYEFIEGDAVDVYSSAKRYIEEGYNLVNHPLYGNFSPRQQPFRTLLLACPDGNSGHKTDGISYQLIESALERYRSYGKNLPKPDDYPKNVRKDYAYLDMVLVEEALASTKCRDDSR